MTKKTITSLLSIIAISALTIGCGSSSSTANTVNQTQTQGTVIDDYISGGIVCVDVNNDGKRNAGDTPCVQTNATGQFTFATDVSASPLVMSGGTDVASGKAFTGTYTAPAGSTVLSPLTTIVQAIVKSTGATVTAAQATVKTSLGLPTGVDLTTYDPIAILSTGTAAEKAEAKTVFAQQSSMQTVLTTVASTIAALVPGTTTSEANLTNLAATEIATLMTAPATAVPINIASSANVETIITTTATAETVNIDPGLVSAIAGQVTATSNLVVSNISNATDITTVRVAAAEVATVVETNIASAVTAIEAGTAQADITGTLNAIDSTALTAAIAAVTIVTTTLTTVATTATQPTVNESTLTGAEGSN